MVFFVRRWLKLSLISGVRCLILRRTIVDDDHNTCGRYGVKVEG
jgi:hypothetical protein